MASREATRQAIGAAVLNGYIYTFGGQLEHNENKENQRVAERYDPKSDTWSPCAPLPYEIGHLGPAVIPPGHGPLILRDPRESADSGRGRQVEAFTENVDLMPTVLGCLGLEPPVQCDGRSLEPFCRGESPPGWRDEAQSSWLLAEEEGPLEDIVMRQRGRRPPAGTDRERSVVDSPTPGD